MMHIIPFLSHFHKIFPYFLMKYPFNLCKSSANLPGNLCSLSIRTFAENTVMFQSKMKTLGTIVHFLMRYFC